MKCLIYITWRIRHNNIWIWCLMTLKEKRGFFSIKKAFTDLEWTLMFKIDMEWIRSTNQQNFGKHDRAFVIQLSAENELPFKAIELEED